MCVFLNSTYKIKNNGTIILFEMYFDCDLDAGELQDCKPEFRFQRLDTDKSWSKGYNYRYVDKYYVPNPKLAGSYVHMRDLVKVFGIRFVFKASGIGRKFDFQVLTVSLGSGLGLLGIATIISDFCLVLLCHNNVARSY